MSKHFAPASLLMVALFSSACASSPDFGPSVEGIEGLSNRASIPVVLVECPGSPNCVNSMVRNLGKDSNDSNKWVAPFELAGDDLDTFQSKLVLAIESDGGVVKDTREGYVWATYTSSVFRFVDDIEWLYNAQGNHFDLRSASRTGYSDFGVNGKRVARLRAILNP